MPALSLHRRALLAAAALAPLPARAGAPRPPLWIVRSPAQGRSEGRGGRLALFGALHVLPPDLDWRRPELLAALAAADSLWFETPQDPAALAAAAAAAAAQGRLPPGVSLSGLLSPEGRARLAAACQRLSIDPRQLEGLAPWYAESTLQLASWGAAGLTLDNGVERQLGRLAPPACRRRGLEDAAGAVRAYGKPPLPQQAALLEGTLAGLDRSTEALRALADAWARGDLDALDRMGLAPLKQAAPGAAASLVADRTARWAALLDGELRRGAQAVVAVGVGHLLGPDSLQAHLGRRGYAVNRVP